MSLPGKPSADEQPADPFRSQVPRSMAQNAEPSTLTGDMRSITPTRPKITRNMATPRRPPFAATKVADWTTLLTPPPSPPQGLAVLSLNTHLPNTFITPKIECNSWDDPLRGIRPDQRAKFESRNKDYVLTCFNFVAKSSLRRYNMSKTEEKIHMSITKEEPDAFGDYSLHALHSVWQQLHYRFGLMSLACRILEYLGLLILPTIYDTGVQLFKLSEGYKNDWSADMVQHATQLVERYELFPKPSSEQGKAFTKPAEYLALCWVP